MTSSGSSTNSGPRNRNNPPEEFIDLAQDEEIAEGDVTVSETQTGHDPDPELDDREIDEDTIGEDDLNVRDEENLGLGLDDELPKRGER